MISQYLKNVEAIWYECEDEGWIRAFLGHYDSYKSEANKECVNEYNNFWNRIVERMNERGHKLSRDGFKKFVEIQEGKE